MHEPPGYGRLIYGQPAEEESWIWRALAAAHVCGVSQSHPLSVRCREQEYKMGSSLWFIHIPVNFFEFMVPPDFPRLEIPGNDDYDATHAMIYGFLLPVAPALLLACAHVTSPCLSCNIGQLSSRLLSCSLCCSSSSTLGVVQFSSPWGKHLPAACCPPFRGPLFKKPRKEWQFLRGKFHRAEKRHPPAGPPLEF